MCSVTAEYLGSIRSLRVTVFATPPGREEAYRGTEGGPRLGVSLANESGEATAPDDLAISVTLSGTGVDGPAVGRVFGVRGLRVGHRCVLEKDGRFEVKAQVLAESDGVLSDQVDQRLLREEKELTDHLRTSRGGESRLMCANCGAPCARFSRVERLPHGSWIESAAQWFCACSGTENALVYLEQVEDGLQPTSGKCLLGETVCILGTEDLVGVPLGPMDAAETAPLSCPSCGWALGLVAPWQSTHGTVENSVGRAATLFKYALTVGSAGDECEDRLEPVTRLFRSYTPTNSLAQDILLTTTSTQKMKYQIRVEDYLGGGDNGDGNGNGDGDEDRRAACFLMVQLVVLNQRVALGHRRLPWDCASGDPREDETRVWTGPCMKVLYKILEPGEGEGEALREEVVRECDDWASSCDANCITVPLHVGSDLANALRESTTELIPKDCASFDSFSIGYLGLIQDAANSLNTLQEVRVSL